MIRLIKRSGRITLSLAAASALLLGFAAPAMAETSPAVGMPPLTEWVFNGSNIDPGVDFDYSGNVVVFPIATNVSSVDAHWNGIDNPAPLLWYAKHVGPTWLGQSMMPQGVKYSPALIATMNAEGFAPSMVGGYNPPGITAGTVQTANPHLTNLQVKGPNGMQPAGTSITYTASAQGNGGTPEYQFWMEKTSGWTVVQNYSDQSTLSLPNLTAGSYPVVVDALNANQIQSGAWSQAQHATFIVNVGSAVSLQGPATLSVNQPVTLTAQAVNLLNPVYQLWYQTPAGQWVQSGSYQTSPTFTVTPATSGAYHFVVYAKDSVAPNNGTFAVTQSVSLSAG